MKQQQENWQTGLLAGGAFAPYKRFGPTAKNLGAGAIPLPRAFSSPKGGASLQAAEPKKEAPAWQVLLFWSWKRDSNTRPADYESAALPTELFQPMARARHSRERLHNRFNIAYFPPPVKAVLPPRGKFFLCDNSSYFCRPPCSFFPVSCISSPVPGSSSQIFPSTSPCHSVPISSIQRKKRNIFSGLPPSPPPSFRLHNTTDNFSLQ